MIQLLRLSRLMQKLLEKAGGDRSFIVCLAALAYALLADTADSAQQ
jgi:hypothetical protein